MTVDSELKHHQETWSGFMKGAVYTGALCVVVLLGLLIFVVRA